MCVFVLRAQMYAHQMGVQMIPLMMEEDYRANGWLGMLLGTRVRSAAAAAGSHRTLQLGQLISSTDISQYCFPVHF